MFHPPHHCVLGSRGQGSRDSSLHFRTRRFPLFTRRTRSESTVRPPDPCRQVRSTSEVQMDPEAGGHRPEAGGGVVILGPIAGQVRAGPSSDGHLVHGKPVDAESPIDPRASAGATLGLPVTYHLIRGPGGPGGSGGRRVGLRRRARTAVMARPLPVCGPHLPSSRRRRCRGQGRGCRGQRPTHPHRGARPPMRSPARDVAVSGTTRRSPAAPGSAAPAQVPAPLSPAALLP